MGLGRVRSYCLMGRDSALLRSGDGWWRWQTHNTTGLQAAELDILKCLRISFMLYIYYHNKTNRRKRQSWWVIPQLWSLHAEWFNYHSVILYGKLPDRRQNGWHHCWWRQVLASGHVWKQWHPKDVPKDWVKRHQQNQLNPSIPRAPAKFIHLRQYLCQPNRSVYIGVFSTGWPRRMDWCRASGRQRRLDQKGRGRWAPTEKARQSHGSQTVPPWKLSLTAADL